MISFSQSEIQTAFAVIFRAIGEGAMDVNHVNEAILNSYQSLRRRIGFLAFAFPVALILVGLGWGIEVQATLSNYYFAQDAAGSVDVYPVRLWFCGILFVVGFFLYKYQGFSKNENRWLSVAGTFALGVAIFPMSINGKNQYDFVLAPFGLTQLSLHGICAVLAFVAIAIVIVRYADSTLSELKDEAAYKWFKTAYFVIAIFMVLSIILAVALNYLHHGQGSYILAAEWAGIWAFGAYWFVKNWELRKVAESMKRRGKAIPLGPRADTADKL
jgi:hypothetical protein